VVGEIETHDLPPLIAPLGAVLNLLHHVRRTVRVDRDLLDPVLELHRDLLLRQVGPAKSRHPGGFVYTMTPAPCVVGDFGTTRM